MNKNDAMERLDAIEREAKKLRRIIEAPEWKPEDLIGKLCYVWDEKRHSNMGVVVAYRKDMSYPFEVDTRGNWRHAEPVEADVAQRMIYRKSRYDWSKAPEWANWASTNQNGHCDWWQDKPSASDNARFVDGGMFKCFGMTNQGSDEKCPDWRESLECRP